MLRTTLLLMAGVTWIAGPAAAQVAEVFRGRPDVRIEESGYERSAKDLSDRIAVHYECVITESGGRYYWASQENTEVARHEDGPFVTYVAADGSGYVKVIASGRKSEAALASETGARFDYTEHLTRGLATLTYYGKRAP